MASSELSAADAVVSTSPQRAAQWQVPLAAAIVILTILVAARWVWTYRHGHLLDIDEAGYNTLAFQHYLKALSDGAAGWLASISAPTMQAPVTPVLTSLVFLGLGPDPYLSFLVPLAAYGLTLWGAYLLASRLSGAAAGMAATALVAACPVLVAFAKSFNFSLPAAAVTTFALVSLLRSNGFNRVGWSMLFGVCFGLMPMTRTMTIAYLPGLALAALLVLLAYRPGLKQWGIAIASALAAVVTAGPWLWMNGVAVFGYLFSFGYGTRSAEYGRAISGLADGLWMLWDRLASSFYLPHVVVLAAGVLCGAIVLWRHRSAGWWRSDTAALCAFVGAGLASLATSSNEGTGFIAPLAPAILVLAAAAIVAVASRVALPALLAVAAVAWVPTIDANLPVAQPVDVKLPGLGRVTVTSGLTHYHLYYGMMMLAEPKIPLTTEEEHEWQEAIAATPSRIRKLNPDGLTVFGFRHLAYNVNSIGLEMLSTTGRGAQFLTMQPLATAPNQYAEWLDTGAAGRTCLLLVSPGGSGEIPPLVDSDALLSAATSLGFMKSDEWTLPRGRIVEAWARRDPSRGCLA